MSTTGAKPGMGNGGCFKIYSGAKWANGAGLHGIENSHVIDDSLNTQKKIIKYR